MKFMLLICGNDTAPPAPGEKGGQRQVTDGPFAETKAALGGFYLIQAASKQEAVEWAGRIPLREGGYVEVRPVWEM